MPVFISVRAPAKVSNRFGQSLFAYSASAEATGERGARIRIYIRGACGYFGQIQSGGIAFANEQ